MYKSVTKTYTAVAVNECNQCKILIKQYIDKVLAAPSS